MKYATAVALSAFVLSVSATAEQGSAGHGAGMSMSSGADQSTPDLSRHRVGDHGLVVARFQPMREPIELNHIHSWVLQLKDGEGRALESADITIDGGMPMHDHGLPTAPAMTAELGDGRYRIDGMKFQMPGHWTVSVEIVAGELRDSVTFDLML